MTPLAEEVNLKHWNLRLPGALSQRLPSFNSWHCQWVFKLDVQIVVNVECSICRRKEFRVDCRSSAQVSKPRCCVRSTSSLSEIFEQWPGVQLVSKDSGYWKQ
eukprot:1727724-Rhodomonas_salina.2